MASASASASASTETETETEIEEKDRNRNRCKGGNHQIDRLQLRLGAMEIWANAVMARGRHGQGGGQRERKDYFAGVASVESIELCDQTKLDEENCCCEEAYDDDSCSEEEVC